MDAKHDLEDAVAELERLQRALAAATNEQRDAWQNELIDLRRKLQVQIAQVSDVADRCTDLNRDTPQGREFREALSRMRTAVALHQANWPAVKIDRSHPDYQRSVGAVRAANQAFIEFARAAVSGFAGPTGRPPQEG